MPVNITSPYFIPPTPTIWIRALGGVNADYAYGIATDPSGNVYVTGQTNTAGATAGDTDVLVAYLPPDGSETGVYGSITYQSISLTDQVAGLTDQSVSLTDQAIALTDQSISLTETVIV